MQQNGAYGDNINRYLNICAQHLRNFTGMNQEASVSLAREMLNEAKSSSRGGDDLQSLEGLVNKIAELNYANDKFLNNKAALQQSAEEQSKAASSSAGVVNSIQEQVRMLSGESQVNAAKSNFANLNISEGMSKEQIKNTASRAINAVDESVKKLNESYKYTESFLNAGMIPHFDVDPNNSSATITWSRAKSGTNVIPIAPQFNELTEDDVKYGRYTSIATNKGRTGDGEKRNMDTHIAVCSKSANIADVSSNIIDNVTEAGANKQALLNHQSSFLNKLSQDENLRSSAYEALKNANFTAGAMANDKESVARFSQACKNAGIALGGGDNELQAYSAASLINPEDISSPDKLSQLSASVRNDSANLTAALNADITKSIYPCVSADGTKVGYTVVDTKSGIPIPCELNSLKYLSSNPSVGGISPNGISSGAINSIGDKEFAPAALGQTMTTEDLNKLAKLTSNIYVANSMALGEDEFKVATENLSTGFGIDKDAISESYRRAYSKSELGAIRGTNSPIQNVVADNDLKVHTITHEESKRPAQLYERIGEIERKSGLPTGSLYSKMNPVGAVVGDKVLARDGAIVSSDVDKVNQCIAKYNDLAKGGNLSSFQSAFEKDISNLDVCSPANQLARLSMQNALEAKSNSMAPVYKETIQAAAQINATAKGISCPRIMSRPLEDGVSPDYDQEMRMRRFADMARTAGLTNEEAERIIDNGAVDEYIDNAIDVVAKSADQRLAIAEIKSYNAVQNGQLVVDKLGYQQAMQDISRQGDRDDLQHEVDQRESALEFKRQGQANVLSLAKDKVALEQAEEYQDGRYTNQVKQAQIEEQGRSMSETAKYKKDMLDRAEKRAQFHIAMKEKNLKEAEKEMEKFNGGAGKVGSFLSEHFTNPDNSIIGKFALAATAPFWVPVAAVITSIGESVSKSEYKAASKEYEKTVKGGRKSVETTRNKLYNTEVEDVDSVEGKAPSKKMDRSTTELDGESVQQMAARLSWKSAGLDPTSSLSAPARSESGGVRRPYMPSRFKPSGFTNTDLSTPVTSVASDAKLPSGVSVSSNPEAAKLKQMFYQYGGASKSVGNVTKEDLTKSVADFIREIAAKDTGVVRDRARIGAAQSATTQNVAPSKTPTSFIDKLNEQRRGSKDSELSL